MTFGTISTFFGPGVDLEQILYLFWGQVLTATRVITPSPRPLLGVDAINVFFDFVRSLVASGPRDCAGPVPEEAVPLRKVVCACDWDWLALPKDEWGPIYI